MACHCSHVLLAQGKAASKLAFKPKAAPLSERERGREERRTAFLKTFALGNPPASGSWG